MLTREQAAEANLRGPIIRCGAEEFVIFGIPADDSCQFGAFFWAGQQQKHFSVADILRLADGEDYDTTFKEVKSKSSRFDFLPANDQLMNSISQQLTGVSTEMLLRCPADPLTLRGVNVDFYRNVKHLGSGD
jgi:hypothetical protein